MLYENANKSIKEPFILQSSSYHPSISWRMRLCGLRRNGAQECKPLMISKHLFIVLFIISFIFNSKSIKRNRKEAPDSMNAAFIAQIQTSDLGHVESPPQKQ